CSVCLCPVSSLLLPRCFWRSRRPARATLFPYTTLFRSQLRSPPGRRARSGDGAEDHQGSDRGSDADADRPVRRWGTRASTSSVRSEEHTSELQSRENLVCRLLLEKKERAHTREDTPQPP